MIVEENLQRMKEIVQPYDNKDVHNMDELELFCKITPDVTLGFKQREGEKYNKTRITINLACNVTRSHKLDFLFIDKTAKL